jgi:hypothetical protein
MSLAKDASGPQDVRVTGHAPEEIRSRRPGDESRVDLRLRLEGVRAGKRLQPSKIHETMRFQLALSSPDELNTEVVGWLKKGYSQNA